MGVFDEARAMLGYPVSGQVFLLVVSPINDVNSRNEQRDQSKSHESLLCGLNLTIPVACSAGKDLFALLFIRFERVCREIHIGGETGRKALNPGYFGFFTSWSGLGGGRLIVRISHVI